MNPYLNFAERLFNSLSAGGVIEMPLEDAFRGAYFGSWRINLASVGWSILKITRDSEKYLWLL